MSDLIAVDEARRRVLAEVELLPAGPVALADALERVLAEDMTSAIDVPPFDSSAMDGFAVRAADPGVLRILGESRAGHPAGVHVEPGTAVRISTGAVVPPGAQAVVTLERTEPAEGAVRAEAVALGENVRRAGEDVTAGDVVLPAGTVLGPAELGVAASVGRSRAQCTARPRVALVMTGDELAEPGAELAPGRIYSSNARVLAGLVQRAGAELVTTEQAGDTAQATRDALDRALASADVVCASGGVSVGPHDHVKAALGDLSVTERFWGVRLRPGKPTWFGVRDRVLAFGLPGNPVSALVTFLLFVRPALAALQGADPAARRGRGRLTEAVSRNPRRDEALRVTLDARDDGWHVTPTGPQGSHMLTSVVGADALAMVTAGDGHAEAGHLLDLELL